MEIRITNKDAKYIWEIASGDKVAAIKEFRGVTGAGLKESKEAVECMMEEVEPPKNNVWYTPFGTLLIGGDAATLNRLMDLLTEVAELAADLREKGVL